MDILTAVILGIVEGITEFLPVSSTAHLTVAEKLLGYSVSDPDVVAFTAVIQLGAVAATLVYFRNDLWRILSGWLRGVVSRNQRGGDYRFGWAVIIGSIPIGIIGLLFKDQIESGLRSLWLVAAALIIWSAVMWHADKTARLNRPEKAVTWRDALIIGLAQCLALIPGVSRSGATMSAGLYRGLDRLAATRIAFFLAIPALLAAGLLEGFTKADQIANGVGWTATIVATAVSFIVAYMAIAWLLAFVARHSLRLFVSYRLAIGLIIVLLLITNIIDAG